jgi:hypothetical protein
MFTRQLENDFQGPLENEAGRHFQMFSVFTPYGGTAPLIRRPTPAVGAWQPRCCRAPNAFRLRSPHGGIGQAPISLRGDG